MDTELDRLGERIAEQAAHFDAAMHQLLVDLREFDERGGWHAQGARSCAHWLSWRVGWTLAAARDHVRVTCTFPGCTNHLYVEGHHIKHWADGGETSLSNAALLCTAHHHYVHEYGYTIELDPDQRPRFRDPHGRLVVAVPEPPVVANLGWPSIRTANEPLAIRPETNACKWDGNPVDYSAVIDYLVVADGVN